MGARGRDTTVSCDYCGRRIPRSRSFTKFKPVIGGVKTGRRYYRPMNKLYLCYRCARKRGVLK